MATTKQERSFGEHIKENQNVDLTLLDKTIDWMRENISPEEVFTDEQLETWAENNGYVKKEDNE